MCGAILVGAVAIVLTTREANSYKEGRHAADQGTIRVNAPALEPWNRYRSFRFAHGWALKATPDLFSMNDFIVQGSNSNLHVVNTDGAIAVLLRVVMATPDEDGAWSDLACLYAIRGDTDAAIATEQKAISLYKYDYTYYALLGAFLERSGRSDEAGSAYGQALVYFPRLAASRFWHTLQSRQAALASAALQFALKQVDRRQGNDDDVNREEVRARLDLESGSLDESVNIVRSINAMLPSRSGIWELQGELNERGGNVGEAALDYRRAIFLDKIDPLPHERLAELDLLASDAADARLEVLEALKLARHPQSPGARRRIMQYQYKVGPRNRESTAAFIQETQPSFNFKAAFALLAHLFASQGATTQANEMKTMLDRIGTHNPLYNGPN